MKSRTGLTVAFLAVFLGLVGAQPAQRFDLLIKNGRVMDGTGNPWLPADIGIQNGRIAAIGQLGNAQATRVIDAAGKYVVPGFIDIHSHADDGSGPRCTRRSRSARRPALAWSRHISRPRANTTGDRARRQSR